MYEKFFWVICFVLLGGLTVWLSRVTAFQGWAQWNGETWVILAGSWNLLRHGWPIALVGALVGAVMVGVGLAFSLQHAKEADFQMEIARLTRQRDAAMAEAQIWLQSREQAVIHRETAALAAQRAAELAMQAAQAARLQAEQAQQDAEAAVSQATLRIRNAVCAAERIKRRVEGKKRLDA